jgi:NTE family protein
VTVHDKLPSETGQFATNPVRFRAMLFHLGALWRLEQAGVLERLDRISSVPPQPLTGKGRLRCGEQQASARPGGAGR